jgi:mRNA-degrading endonuclease RelE of RelBE toxin-antitoxin system
MRVLTTPRFDRAVKKLLAQEKKALDSAVHAVTGDLSLREFKKDDLAGVRVYKYRYNKEQMLLAYAANKEEQVVILMGFGSHENFYRDLKH